MEDPRFDDATALFLPSERPRESWEKLVHFLACLTLLLGSYTGYLYAVLRLAVATQTHGRTYIGPALRLDGGGLLVLLVLGFFLLRSGWLYPPAWLNHTVARALLISVLLLACSFFLMTSLALIGLTLLAGVYLPP